MLVSLSVILSIDPHCIDLLIHGGLQSGDTLTLSFLFELLIENILMKYFFLSIIWKNSYLILFFCLPISKLMVSHLLVYHLFSSSKNY